MQITKHYCDVCGKEIRQDSIKYTVSLSCETGIVMRKDRMPNRVECCSKVCVSDWCAKT